MATKKQKEAATTMSIANCNFEINGGTNEHTQAAVVALAGAAQANAEAIAAIAVSLRGSTAVGPAISLSSGK